MENAVTVKSPFVLTDHEIEERLGETLANIGLLKKEYCSLKVSGIDDEQGYKIVHTAKMDMVHRRNNIKKNGLASRKDANDFCASVLRIEKRLNQEISPIEDYLISQEKIVDDEKARIKAEAEAKEAARIQARIDRLFAFGCSFQGVNYFLLGKEVPQAIVKTCPDEQFDQICGEFKKLVDAENSRVEAEKAAKIEEENRLNKIRAEQEAEAKRLADIRAAQDKQAAEIKAAKDAIEAEKKRIADEEAAILKAIADAEVLENARKEAAEKARIETEERIKREAKEKEEKERKEKIAAEKKAARAPDKEKLLKFALLFEVPDNPKMATVEGKEILDVFNQNIEDAITDLRKKVEAL